MHIFLTGFMGCGKTTVTRIISRISSMEFFDTDNAIELKDGRPIPRIFEESGEGYFRRLETMILRELSSKDPCVVSCGGGIVLRTENTDIMKSSGTVVYLMASPEVILDRVSRNNNRPLLEGNKNIEFISDMMEKRTPYYEAAADITVDVGTMTAESVAEAVMKACGVPRSGLD